MESSHIAFKFTTRSRPDLFRRGMKSIIENVADKNNYSILVTCDVNDNTMTDVCKEYKQSNVQFVYGYSKGKIDAINRDLEYLYKDFDILVNMSDDMVFTEKGFDNEIRNGFNNDFDLCLHYPDGFQDRIITMSILGVDYFKRFGYIYHPSYISLWCDNEQTDVAKALNRYKYIDLNIFNHLHPANTIEAINDAQYQFTESFNDKDKLNYYERKKNNFDL